MNRRTYLLLAGGLVVLLLGVGAIFAASRLRQTAETSQNVAPNAPQSLPKAQQTQTLPTDPLVLTFNVTGAPAVVTPTPTAAPAGATATPTPTPAAGGSAATATPTPTPTARAAATGTVTPTPTPQALPKAGMALPTVFAIIGGVLLLGVGLFLAL